MHLSDVFVSICLIDLLPFVMFVMVCFILFYIFLSFFRRKSDNQKGLPSTTLAWERQAQFVGYLRLMFKENRPSAVFEHWWNRNQARYQNVTEDVLQEVCILY